MDEQIAELRRKGSLCLRAAELLQDIISQKIRIDRQEEFEEKDLPILAAFADQLHRALLKRQHLDIADHFA